MSDEQQIKQVALKAAQRIDLMSAMSMTRRERRALGKENGVRIAGSNTPYVNLAKRQRKEEAKAAKSVAKNRA